MQYTESQLPLDINWRMYQAGREYFTKQSPAQLSIYKRWFLAAIPDRVCALEQAIRSSQGYGNWAADYTPVSLLELGSWFERHVETSRLTGAERERARKFLVPYAEVHDSSLTHRTNLLAVDVGMYFGEVVRRAVPGAKWEQVLDDKRNVDFGQIVVQGRGKVPLEPVGIARVVAHQFVKRTKPSARLRELYEIWVQQLLGTYKPPDID